MLRFIIVAAPRTGSNLLCTLLDSHPEILCHHELFNPNGIFTSLRCRGERSPFGTIAERDRDPFGFLKRVWRDEHECHCVGFKWTRGQSEIVMRQVLTDSSVKKIVLRRRNRIKTYVSEKVAQQTQQWEVYDEKQLVTPPRIKVEDAELRRHIRLNETFYTDLEDSLTSLRQPHIELTYESLLMKEEQRRLLEFLCVDDSDFELRAASVKQNPTDLRDSIANFSELAASLSCCGLEAELYERDS